MVFAFDCVSTLGREDVKRGTRRAMLGRSPSSSSTCQEVKRRDESVCSTNLLIGIQSTVAQRAGNSKSGRGRSRGVISNFKSRNWFRFDWPGWTGTYRAVGATVGIAFGRFLPLDRGPIHIFVWRTVVRVT